MDTAMRLVMQCGIIMKIPESLVFKRHEPAQQSVYSEMSLRGNSLVGLIAAALHCRFRHWISWQSPAVVLTMGA
jgi:hypothetical protein